MTTLTSLVVAVLAVVVVAVPAVAQSPVGALAIDERQGDQWGWAVDYDTAAAAQEMALQECGSDCSVVLTFDRCAAYAADQDADSTAVGWAESYDSATGARQAALAECVSRGGPGCMVRVWGCNGPVVEEDLRLNRATRRQIQLGLRSQASTPGARTVCSVRGRGRRFGTGSRRAGDVRPGIWTARRSRRCEAGARGSLWRRPAPQRMAAGWKSCSGSRSRTARTRRTSRHIWSSFRTGCSAR